MTLHGHAMKTADQLVRLVGEHGIPNKFGSGDETGNCNTSTLPQIAGRIGRRPELVGAMAQRMGFSVEPQYWNGAFTSWLVFPATSSEKT